MVLLLILFVFVILFSLLTVAELAILRKLGFDIIAHLKVSHSTGKKGKFFFEAFGAIAFIIFQPALLTYLLVWAFGKLNPLILHQVAEQIKPQFLF